ncbi:uncharacterized protein LOC128859956 [Anastrepha ludens]|uniref:uncharacterized protein LOC128859956 n=1 Tax=Anastrepha ludens TaxID=28586 RepID=UPI0023B09CFF|nr:uncharacterized protein LOC128859956 [Anastrepha ludens]
MSSCADASTSTTKPNPLQDDDLSELTKREILFWARKLKLSPSELFTLSKQDLERHLARAQQEEFYDEQRKNQYARLEKLSEMKRFLLEEQYKERLKGGGSPNRRTVWDILCTAANEIESMYAECMESSGSYGGTRSYSPSRESGYQSPSFSRSRQPPVPNMCSTIYQMHPEDTRYTPPGFPSTLSTTPISYTSSQRRNIVPSSPLNATYNVNAPNATYNVCAPMNATFNLQRNGAANATCNVRRPQNVTFHGPRAISATYNTCPPRNVTYKVSQNPNATYDVCPQPRNATYSVPRGNANVTYNVPQARATNATYNVCPNATYNVSGGRNRTFNAASQQGRGNITFDVGSRSRNTSPSFAPNPVMASTPKKSPRTGRKPYFRNYTDYCMTLSGLGITEASQSISYDVFSDNKRMVRAAARTYSIPHRSKSCPPRESTSGSQYPVNSGSSIQCPRAGSQDRSSRRCLSPVKALAAANLGFSPLARQAASRLADMPQRLCQGKIARGFCDCERRSRSLPRC